MPSMTGDEEISVCDEKGLICWHKSNSIYVEKISHNDIIGNNLKFDNIYRNGDKYYRSNNNREDIELSKSDYDSLINYYNSLKWTKLNFQELEKLQKNAETLNSQTYSKPEKNVTTVTTTIFSGTKKTSENNNIKGVEFKSQYEAFQNNNLENAPADMEFYNKELENDSITYGKKSGNNTVVLRKGPSVNYETIFDDLIIIDGATTVIIYGESKDWYYIYYHPGAGGGLNFYLGYVEKSQLTKIQTNQTISDETIQP